MSVRRNATYNLFGAVIPLAVSLVTIPVYLAQIGEARYGVLAIAWLLLGYFGLFDLGLGRATAQRIAALRHASAADRARTFWTALALNSGLGVIGGIVIWPVASYFFGNVFKVEDVLRPELIGAVPWLAVAVPMATISGVLSGALQGREHFAELNLVSVCGAVLFQLLPLATTFVWGPDLAVLLPAALFARLVVLVVLFARCRRHIFTGFSCVFERAQAGRLLRFGGWVSVTSFVGPMMVSLDRFIIGALAGAKAVTFYTVPFQLGENSTVVSNALSSALFPRFAVATAAQQRQLAQQALRSLVTVMTPLVAVGVFLMEPFLAWWISPAFAEQSARIGQILLLAFWANSFAKIPYAQLQARGRPDLVAKCHLAELFPYFALLYFAMNLYGLVGAAMAFSLRVLVDLGLLAGLAGMLPMLLRIIVAPALLLVMASAIAIISAPWTVDWLVMAGLHVSITIIWAWRQAPRHLTELLPGRAKPLLASHERPR